MTSPAFLNDELSKRTSIFGLRLWVVIGICVGAAIVLVLSLYFTSKRYGRRGSIKPNWLRKKLSAESVGDAKGSGSPLPQMAKPTIPSVLKEIQEIRVEGCPGQESMALALLPQQQQQEEDGSQRIHIEIEKENMILCPERGQGSGEDGSSRPAETNELSLALVVGQPEVSQLGWGHWFTLRELEEATDGFTPDNVIGEGGYGIVYKGVLEDSTRVAVKNLLNNRGQAEKEFRVEVEAIGRVRHKNLVRLLGYCVEGEHRMFVYEYVDNGNLEQWLHGEVGPHSPLTWDIRMQIIAGTAKGLTYLHEGLEPKVVHRDIKSSNILLDQQWNPKVSDFGLAKLLGSEKSYVTTRVMGTFGYVAPEYASTGMLNERSDVYSFGILLMEIISGRSPVDYSRPPGEVNLVECLKTMVTDRNAEGILDPRLAEKPSSRALKRALLVALRCVDPNAQKRPKMGHVVHMLEADEFPFRDERRSEREHGFSHRYILRSRLMDKQVNESDDGSGYESSVQSSLSALRRQDVDEQ